MKGSSFLLLALTLGIPPTALASPIRPLHMRNETTNYRRSIFGRADNITIFGPTETRPPSGFINPEPYGRHSTSPTAKRGSSCGIHVRQFWPSHWLFYYQGHPGLHASVSIKDSRGHVIGSVSPKSFTRQMRPPYTDLHPVEVKSTLSDVLYVAVQDPADKENDGGKGKGKSKGGDRDLYFRYKDDAWTSSDKARCSVGGQDRSSFVAWLFCTDVHRDMDCGFTC
ncbi:MAG: hypothetical protein M1825_001658 [Sarcosagium campestre]|nr:MAG: hypothetical protein M1825_001658 [Sarcosagium campestre]